MDIIVNNTAQKTGPKSKIRRTRDDWIELVAAWEGSNQTQQAFCQERALCYRQFNQWKSRFKKERGSVPQCDAEKFVPVQLKSSVIAQPVNGVQVRLPNGIQIDASHDGDLNLTLSLAKELVAISC